MHFIIPRMFVTSGSWAVVRLFTASSRPPWARPSWPRSTLCWWWICPSRTNSGTRWRPPSRQSRTTLKKVGWILPAMSKEDLKVERWKLFAMELYWSEWHRIWNHNVTHVIMKKKTLNEGFFKNVPIPASFCLFLSFQHDTNQYKLIKA